MPDITLSRTTLSSPPSQTTAATDLNPGSSTPQTISHDQDGGVLLSADVYWAAFPVMDQVLYVLEVIGLVLNVLNIIVMTRPSMRSPTSTFLVALSVLQLVYILISLIPAIHRIFKPLVFTDAFYLINSIYIINYVLTSLRRSMYCLQCFISAERFLAVWLPLKAKQFLLVRRPWLFICITPVVILLVHIHVPLKIEIFETLDQQNQTIHSFRYSQYYRSDPEAFSQLSILMKIVFVYLTLCTLVAINLAMIYVIKRSASVRKKMKTNVDMIAAQRRESQMTLTILVSTLIFVVLCLPTVSSSLAANAAPKSYGPFSLHRYLYLFMNKFGGLLFVLAFSTDFFTYISLSSAYRNTLLHMFKLKKQQETFSSLKTGSTTAISTLT